MGCAWCKDKTNIDDQMLNDVMTYRWDNLSNIIDVKEHKMMGLHVARNIMTSFEYRENRIEYMNKWINIYCKKGHRFGYPDVLAKIFMDNLLNPEQKKREIELRINQDKDDESEYLIHQKNI